MAVWQFDFHLEPAGEWGDTDLQATAAEISKLLPRTKSPNESKLWWWGTEEGTRIDVSHSRDKVSNIMVRIDVRDLSQVFIINLLELARQKNWSLRFQDDRIIQPSYAALLKEIQKSAAFFFVENPKKFLEDLNKASHDKDLMEKAAREFDFKSWREWLRGKTKELQEHGHETEFLFRSDSSHKPAMILEIVGRKALGMFQNWITGETDYTIHAPPGGPMVSHRWSVQVNDKSFESVFSEFVSEFRKYDSAS